MNGEHMRIVASVKKIGIFVHLKMYNKTTELQRKFKKGKLKWFFLTKSAFSTNRRNGKQLSYSWLVQTFYKENGGLILVLKLA